MGSMRMTSAPSWARCRPQDGPAMNEAASTTRRPARTSCMVDRRNQTRERPSQELAVAAPRQRRHEEDLPRALVGGEACQRVGEDRSGIDRAALLPHYEGNDDAHVGAHPIFADRDLGDIRAFEERRLDLQ